MKTKKEIEKVIADCDDVRGLGLSKGPCPFGEDGEKGCCAECGAIGVLKWVLEEKEEEGEG